MSAKNIIEKNLATIELKQSLIFQRKLKFYKWLELQNQQPIRNSHEIPCLDFNKNM